MKLAAFIKAETGVPEERIMFLRHGNKYVKQLRQCGGKVEELNSLQPIDSDYDYLKSDAERIALVVVVVDDLVYGVYMVAGVEAEGRYDELASPELRKHEGVNFNPHEMSRKFVLNPVNSACTGLAVRWVNAQNKVLRSHTLSFGVIEVGPPDDADTRSAVETAFANRVSSSLRDTASTRAHRLAGANKVPGRMVVQTVVYVRNPDVVAEVLTTAAGRCGRCGGRAPFIRRSDDTPYLEVHHRLELSKGGEDTVENAIALCPNCHREAHYG